MSENQNEGTSVPEAEQSAADVFACNAPLIEQMRAKHGDIEVIRQKGLPGVIIVATPPRAAYRAFMDQVANEKASNASAAENLALASCVHPERDVLKGYLDKKPGLGMKITTLAQSLSGADADVLGKD